MCLLEDETDEEGETPVVWINAKTTTAQLLAAQEQEKKEKKTIDDILPEPYKKYRHLFEDRPETALPPHRKWDHKIDLKSGFVPKVFKTYQLTPAEDQELQKFLEENLRLGRIRPSQSPMGSPLSSSPRRTENYAPAKTTAISTIGPSLTPIHYLELTNSWIDSKALGTLPNWTSNGGTTIFESEREMSGKPPSRRIEDSTNRPSCSSENATHQQPSRT
ncbi:hypothetical protein CC2G_006771 [Coprinopsis cinerea AmutBmut pab1-1]|nr:hypothetical protein CC2G_006771 [Coprinopsis cinerea AmutBmut pab1-1]